MNWKFKEFKLLLLELVFFVVGGCIVFPLTSIVGIVYSFFKHLLIKLDYSVSKQLIPILRSMTLASDGLANACGGEMLNDALKVKQQALIKYGKWYQTISAVTGLRKVFDSKDTWLRRFLEILGKNHCEEAITDQERFYYEHQNSNIV